MIYFDQAATSFPKPPEVIEKMVKVLTEMTANPGRSGHRLARKANQIIEDARERAADLFGCTDPKKCLFFPNATVAINQAIKGLPWQAGDHVITTSLEHNSIRRPLEYLKKTQQINISYIDWQGEEAIFIQSVKDAIREETKLIAMTHASNVTGDVLPLQAVLDLAYEHDIFTLVDASQTAGHIPLHMKDQHINLLIFPGHKGLLGPQGTGMLLVEGDIDLEPIHHGGTGILSELIDQPEQWPERYESGTLNTAGIAGLSEALKLYQERMKQNVSRETILTFELKKALHRIDGVTIYGHQPLDMGPIPIVAFNIKHISSQEIATILDSHYDIAVRAGLHCNPLQHASLNTTEQGVVRASLSLYNTENEIETFIRAIHDIVNVYNTI